MCNRRKINQIEVVSEEVEKVEENSHKFLKTFYLPAVYLFPIRRSSGPVASFDTISTAINGVCVCVTKLKLHYFKLKTSHHSILLAIGQINVI